MVLKPKTREEMTVWHLIINNFGVPLIILLCSLILWMGQLYLNELSTWRKDVDRQRIDMDKRLEHVEWIQNIRNK